MTNEVAGEVRNKYLRNMERVLQTLGGLQYNLVQVSPARYRVVQWSHDVMLSMTNGETRAIAYSTFESRPLPFEDAVAVYFELAGSDAIVDGWEK